MAKNSITDYDNIAANNTDIQSVDIDEGCAPSGINNAIRELMADLADVNDGTVPLASPDINGGTIDGVTIGAASAGAITGTTITASSSFSGNLTGNVTGNVDGIVGGTTPAAGTFTTFTSTGIDDNASSTAVTIDSTGNVGVNTSSPGSFFSGGNQLVVGDGSGAQGLTIYADSASHGQILFADGTTGNEAYRGIVRYDHVTDSMQIMTSGASERLRIDASGNVGIGTSSPATYYKLHVNDSSNTFAYTKYTNSTTGTDNADGLTVGISSANALIYNYESGNIQFATAGTESMRITSSGKIKINTTGNIISSNEQMTVVNTSNSYAGAFQSNSSGAGAIILNNLYGEGTATTRNLAIFRANNGNRGSITTNGSTTAYNTSSDYRLKTDIQLIADATVRLKQLKPVNFEWIADGSRVDGFIAHEAQAVVPESVVGEKDAMIDEEYEVTPAVYEDVVIPAVVDDEGNEVEPERTEQRLVSEAVMATRSVPDYQGIDQSKLVPLITAALQEAIAEIETLKTKVAALEGA